MHPLTYLHFQLQLEGMIVEDHRLMKDGQAPGPEPVKQSPWLVLARLTTQELVAYYDESLEAGLRKKLEARLDKIQFPHVEPLLEVLNAHGRKAQAEHFVTYVFPPYSANAADRMVLRYRKQDPRVQAFGFDGLGEHVFGIEQDGRVVSACVSSRENELCAEAWVQTAPEHRRQGLAGKVVRAWAKSLMDTGKIPFYSHAAGNQESAGLATKLGLQAIFEEINLSAVETSDTPVL